MPQPTQTEIQAILHVQHEINAENEIQRRTQFLKIIFDIQEPKVTCWACPEAKTPH